MSTPDRQAEPTYKKYVAVISLIVAVIGVPLFFVKEYQAVQSERRQRTLAYAEKFQSGELFAARQQAFG